MMSWVPGWFSFLLPEFISRIYSPFPTDHTVRGESFVVSRICKNLNEAFSRCAQDARSCLAGGLFRPLVPLPRFVLVAAVVFAVILETPSIPSFPLFRPWPGPAQLSIMYDMARPESSTALRRLPRMPL